jgi:hypothetical protein
MALNKRVIERALNATFGESTLTPFRRNAEFFGSLDLKTRKDVLSGVPKAAENIENVVARTNQVLDQGAPVLRYDSNTNMMSTISNTNGTRTVKRQQFAAESVDDANKNLHGFLMQHSSEYQQNVRFATAQRKQELSYQRVQARRNKAKKENFFDADARKVREEQLMGARERGQIKQDSNAEYRLNKKEMSPAQRAQAVEEFDAPINQKYQKDMDFLTGKSQQAADMGNYPLQGRIDEGIKKFEAGEITDPEDIMRMNYKTEKYVEPTYGKQSIMDRVMRRPKEEITPGGYTYEKNNVGEALGYEFKGAASKQKSNGSINPVSSEKAGAGDVTPGDMGYAGFSNAFERHAAGAAIGAGMGMMSEGEVSVGGAARGAMFGVVGGKAARMFTGSMRGGAVNSMARGVGDTLSSAGPNTMRETAGQFINKTMSGFDAAKSQEAMRMATFAGAGLAGFSMGRDRNHSRGMNGSRGSRF